MKLFLFCTFIALPGLARSVDVQCAPNITFIMEVTSNGSIREINDIKSCDVIEPVTIKVGEKMNIVSENDLNSIEKIKFYTDAGRRCEISRVPKELFEQLPNLEILSLYATVEVLNKGDFEKAVKLKHLIIGNNQLKTIPAGVFDSAKNLEGLTLSDNKISEIEDKAFSGLNALFYINLDRNELTIIKQNTFSGLEKLRILYLHWNEIESIEENALYLPNLEELYVKYNKLSTLPDNVFSATPLLKVFHASSNQINHIGKSLYGLKNLKMLYLGSNKLTDVDFMAFSQMPLLKELFISSNRLTSDNFRKIEIKEPSKSVLTWLLLDHNELTSNYDWKKLGIFPQLETIYVWNNKFTKMDLGDKTLRQLFPNLTKVNVSPGEWSCDWLKNFVESSEKDGIHIANIFSSKRDGNEVNGIECV